MYNVHVHVCQNKTQNETVFFLVTKHNSQSKTKQLSYFYYMYNTHVKIYNINYQVFINS